MLRSREAPGGGKVVLLHETPAPVSQGGNPELIFHDVREPGCSYATSGFRVLSASRQRERTAGQCAPLQPLPAAPGSATQLQIVEHASVEGSQKMVEKPKITRDTVSKIEGSLEERKTRKDRRQVAMKLPKALERRAGGDRRSRPTPRAAN